MGQFFIQGMGEGKSKRSRSKTHVRIKRLLLYIPSVNPISTETMLWRCVFSFLFFSLFFWFLESFIRQYRAVGRTWLVPPPDSIFVLLRWGHLESGLSFLVLLLFTRCEHLEWNDGLAYILTIFGRFFRAQKDFFFSATPVYIAKRAWQKNPQPT